MTRRSPRGAENRGGEGEDNWKQQRRGWGGGGGGGELQQQMQAFSHYHALLSVKC